MKWIGRYRTELIMVAVALYCWLLALASASQGDWPLAFVYSLGGIFGPFLILLGMGQR